MKLRLAVGAFGMAIAFVVVPACLASGGGSIVGAVQVQPGQTYFGDTSQATIVDGLPWEFWKVDLLAQDQVVFDWKDTNNATNSFAFWTPAVNDYNLHDSPTLENVDRGGFSGGPASQELTFTATGGTAAYPFAFYTNNGCLFCLGQEGPYQFVLYIKHALTVTLPPLNAIPRSGTVKGNVQSGDGTPYTGPEPFGLYGQQPGGKYIKVAGAIAKRGVLTFHLKLARSFSGKQLHLLIFHGADTNYVEAKSLARLVRVKS